MTFEKNWSWGKWEYQKKQQEEWSWCGKKEKTDKHIEIRDMGRWQGNELCAQVNPYTYFVPFKNVEAPWKVPFHEWS